MQTYEISVGGQFPATMVLQPPSDLGYVTGTLTSPENGIGSISALVLEDGKLKGNAVLGFHYADFFLEFAQDGSVSGYLRLGWFMQLNFTGTRTD